MKKITGAFALLILLSGCPFVTIEDGTYYVYYNDDVIFSVPSDDTAYRTGERAIVLSPRDTPEGYSFKGWREEYSGEIYKPGDRITIWYNTIWLNAFWIPTGEGGGGSIPTSKFTYTTDEEGASVTITGYTGTTGGSITIPSEIEKKSVTAIAEGAFYNKSLTAVNLPETLQSIGGKAFADNFISTLVIPDSVTDIGINAFQRNSITKIDFGTNVESIGAYAFDGNTLNPDMTLIFPKTLQSIGEGAFKGNSVESLRIGENVNIKSSSLGVHGASFSTYYEEQGRQAGIYQYRNGAWSIK
ncbi:hypothetical protein FACS1894164_17540 [Spirochaetia bacterium]|nr:hypothetical protein FACS1894164_17540 [Spirochaetia bacterium]